MERKDFRIVFMGTPEFAVDSLDMLYKAGYNIRAVVTAPDKPAGRGKKLKQPEVKRYALEKGIEVLQPVKLKETSFVEKLKSIKPHLGVVVAFRMLPRVVWSLPEFGTINLHASLLPQYRGAAPINHVLINGEKETGLTTFFLDEEIDTGKIILQQKISIGDDEYLDSLHDRMKIAGARLLLETVDLIREGKAKEIPQESMAPGTEKLKPAPKIFKNDCKIEWNLPVRRIYDKIRGLSPFPAPFSFLINGDGKKTLIKIYKAVPEKSAHDLEPGTIVTDNKKYLKVAAADGFVNITELQSQGRKRMSADAFLRGFKIEKKMKFETD